MVIDKPQKVEIQKIDSMVVLIWPGDLMLKKIVSAETIRRNTVCRLFAP